MNILFVLNLKKLIKSKINEINIKTVNGKSLKKNKKNISIDIKEKIKNFIVTIFEYKMS